MPETERRILPRCVAQQLKHVILPPWVAQCCGAPAGSSVEVLSRLPLPTDHAARAAIEFFSAELVRKHAEQLSPVLVLPTGVTLKPDALESTKWPSRVLTALAKDPLGDELHRVAGLTLGDLLGLRGVGVKSAMDAAIAMEDLSSEKIVEEPLSDSSNVAAAADLDAAIRCLRTLQSQAWPESAYPTDPRWRELLPDSGESLAAIVEHLLRAIELPGSRPHQTELFPAFVSLGLRSATDIVNWCNACTNQYAQLKGMLIEELLSNLLGQSAGIHGERRAAMLARLGWAGQPPKTLEEVGQMIGVTRERIRQIESKIRKRLPPAPVVVPAVEEALRLLADVAPIAVIAAANLLREKKISRGAFSPESVIAAANDLGLDCPIEVAESKGVEMVVRADSVSHVGRILRLARKASGAAGVVNCLDIAAKVTQESDTACKADEVEAVLSASPHFRPLGGNWFWATDLPSGRNRVVNICRKMLSVTSPISARRLRDGLRREFNFRNYSSSGRLNLRVPPIAVLKAFLNDHPGFKVSGEDEVRSTEVLDYRTELGESDRVLVDVLRSSPAMVLDRQSLLAGCVERGSLVQTASTELTYSCVIEHLDTNIWTLRGANVNPAAVEALRRANALRPKERRVRDFGWTTTGELWIAAVVPSALQTLVFGCPGGARSIVAGQKFAAFTPDSLPCGSIGVTDDGTVYGFGPFIELSGADEGDLLIVEFDLLKQTARLVLGDEELLESYGAE